MLFSLLAITWLALLLVGVQASRPDPSPLGEKILRLVWGGVYVLGGVLWVWTVMKLIGGE